MTSLFVQSRNPRVLAGDSVTRHNTHSKEETKETACSRIANFTTKIKLFRSK